METVNPALANLLPVMDNPNVRSFLDMISAAEGTTKHGYNTLFGGGRVDSLTDHPRQLFDFTETTGRPNKTTAAGRYQFLSNTWDEQAKKLGLPDFGERSQDLAAINLLRERGILPDVLQGNWDTAVKKSGPIWASLPSSPYPQPRQSEAFVMGQLNSPRNQVASGPVTSDVNPITMPNQRANPFSALNEEFRIGAPVQQQQQARNPFEELNAEFAIRPVESTAAPVTAAPKQNQPFDINQLLRPVGLTARAGIEGVGSLVGMPLEPSRMALESVSTSLGGPRVASAEQLSSKLADLLRLPKPAERSIMDQGVNLERVGFDVAKTMAGAAGGAGAAGRLAPLATNATSANVLNQLAANPVLQTLSGAGAGAGGSIAREYNAGPGFELGASILGGLAAPMIGAGGKSATTAAIQKLTPSASPAQVDQMITLTLGKSGVDFKSLDDQIQRTLRNDVASALQTGGELSGDTLRRLLDFRMVQGATPTKGMITQDPRQITQEMNLAKTGMNSTNPDLQTLGNVQNANNQALIQALNKAGAGKVGTFEAGEANIANIAAKDLAKQTETSALYKQAQGMPGGDVPLNRSDLMQNIDTLLAKNNKAAFLPDEIKTMLNTISKGETTINGQVYPVPFDTMAIDNLMTTIAKAQRSTSDGNVKQALSLVRQAIDETEIKPIKKEFGGNQLVTESGAKYLQGKDAESQQLLDALNQARSSHKARMDWQQSSNPIEATINGMQPDNFVKKFVLSGTVADAAAVASAGNPTATKNAILSHLKEKALGVGQTDEVGKFGARTFNKALADIGDKKLELFFNKQELDELKRIGRVGTYMTNQPVGTAVNNSNSGALVIGSMIDGIATLAGFSPVGIGASLAVPVAKSVGSKALRNVTSASAQKDALRIAEALQNRVPGIALGDTVSPAVLYGSLLQNPQLMQQLGQRLNQTEEQR
jgi:muramidase (phage lysozyme)